MTDSSTRLESDDEPMVQFDKASGSGGANRGAVKRWKQQEEHIEARFEGAPPKKLKVGEQTIGALFNAAEEAVRTEEGYDELEVDEDKLPYFDAEEEESWVNVPIMPE